MNLQRSIAMAEAAKNNAKRDRDEFLAKIKDFINKVKEPNFRQLNRHQIRIRRERLTYQFQQLETTQRLYLNYTAEEERAAARAEVEGIEDQYLDTLAEMDARLLELEAEAAPQQAAGAAPQVQPQLLGPNGVQQIELKMAMQPQNITNTWGKFNGNLLDWADFKQRFKIAVHDIDPEQLKPDFKIQYLRDALTGEAADVAKGFSMVAANYQPLWEALIKAYEHKYRLACAFLTKFFALPALKAPVSSTELNRMITTTNETLRQINELEYRTENWDLLIIHALQERLPNELRSKWTGERIEDPMPTIEKMLTFLDKKSKEIGSDSFAQAALQVKIANNRVNSQNTGTPSSSGRKKFPCPICTDITHETDACPEFKPLPLAERYKSAQLNRLCFLCLKHGHFTSECFKLYRCQEEMCRRSGKTNHHELLCEVKDHKLHVNTVQDQVYSFADQAKALPPYGGRGRGRPNDNERKRGAPNNQS